MSLFCLKSRLSFPLHLENPESLSLFTDPWVIWLLSPSLTLYYPISTSPTLPCCLFYFMNIPSSFPLGNGHTCYSFNLIVFLLVLHGCLSVISDLSLSKPTNQRTSCVLLPLPGLFKLSVLYLPYSVSHLFVFFVPSSISSHTLLRQYKLYEDRLKFVTTDLSPAPNILPEAWQSLFQ